MTDDDRKTLKLQPDTFDALKADKPDGATWDYYLLELRTLDEGRT